MLHCYVAGCGCVLSVLLYCRPGAAYSAITSHEFSRYQVILDKKPFGEVASLEAPKQEAALNDVITRELEMKSIVDEGGFMRVGWLDKKTKKNFSLAIGENHEGLQLISVDYDNEEAVVKKGGETAVVRLHQNKNKTAPPAAALPAAFAALTAPGPGASHRLAKSRRPFVTDLRKRRSSPFKPVGTNKLPFQAKPLDSFFRVSTGAFPRAQSPFGPFPGRAEGAKGGNPFKVLSSGGTNVVAAPFTPVMPAGGQFVPQNSDADNQKQDRIID